MIKENSLYELISKHRNELMGVATLLVIFDHCWIRLFSNIPFLFEIETFMKEHSGFIGVNIFIFLSGFGLPNSYEKKKSIKNFYMRRFKRMLVPYILSSIFYCLYRKWTFFEFFCQTTMISFFIEEQYPFLWFVPAIAFIYLLFPVYYEKFIKAENKVSFTIKNIALWLITYVFLLYMGMSYEPFKRFFTILPIFLIGVLFNNISKKMQFSYISIIGIFLSITIFVFQYNKEYNDYLYLIYIVLPVIVLSVSFVYLYSYISDKFKPDYCLFKILKFIGSLSFESYCIQVLLDNILIDKILVIIGPIMTNIIFLIIVLSFSYLMKKINDFCWENNRKINF